MVSQNFIALLSFFELIAGILAFSGNYSFIGFTNFFLGIMISIFWLGDIND